MNLLQMTSLPIQLQYEVQNARLEMHYDKKTVGNLTIHKPQMNIKTQNIQMRMSSEAMFSSLGIKKDLTRARENRDKGVQAAMQATGDYARMGNLLKKAGSREGVTIAQVAQNKLMNRNFVTTHTYLPAVGPEISWTDPMLDMNFQPGSVEIDWDDVRGSFEYIPGKFSLHVLQYPKVNIEYIGGFNYVPPSSAPDYEE